jgi:hypothetical protein
MAGFRHKRRFLNDERQVFAMNGEASAQRATEGEPTRRGFAEFTDLH